MKKTVLAMRTAGHPFTGVLYGGFMLTADGPMVLEFNCRFGDPETQVVLSLLNSDLYDIMMSCCTGTLDAQEVSFNTSQSAVGVVLASGGYPNKYNKGLPITGIDLLPPGIKVFHAGTAFNKKGELTTSGGRVLAVVSVGNSLQEAAAEAQRAAAAIQFEGAFFRRDIAHAALTSGSSKGMTYLDAGVDIAAGDKLVSCIKPLCKSTQVPGCVGSLGLFGSVFDLKLAEFKDPLLVSGTDGVGTKLLVALECGNHSTVVRIWWLCVSMTSCVTELNLCSSLIILLPANLMYHRLKRSLLV
ncbi:GART [Bugula neritina]|uniref:GART n=1 Tax=Bugula neritina TaxID=10212 RepID=A0A7J7KT78_BUGNE|nr:GART [Bugula neritina]